MAQISVIVPVYKVEPYLQRCVDSILAQTFTDFELILVDDGSPDNCGKICDEYAENDNRIVVIHQENGGLSAARNTGLDWAFSNSDSKWIAFVDSDDWVDSRYLEYLLNACLQYDVDISVCNFLRTSGELIQQTAIPVFVKIEPVKLWAEELVAATVSWNKLYRKSLWLNTHFPIGKIHEDEYTTYKLLFSCERVAFTESSLYYYFKNLDGIMLNNFSLRKLDAVQAFRNQLDFFIDNDFQGLIDSSVCRLFNKENWLLNKLIENGYAQEESNHIKKEIKSDEKKYRKYLSFIKRCEILSVAYPQYRFFLHIYALPKKLGIKK